MLAAIPGPGTYVPSVKVGKEGLKYSMGGRNESPHTHIAVPGPGAYSAITTSKSATFS